MRERVESMGPPPGKKPKKAKPKKDPKPRKPKKGRKSKENPQPEETPLVGHQGEDPLIGEQDPAPGSDPVPRTTPKAGGYRPLRRRDVTFETQGGANTIGDGPRSG